MQRRFMLLAAMSLAFGLVLSGCSGGSESHADTKPTETETVEEAIAVRTALMSRETLSELYDTTATLRAEKRATVTSRTQGVVEKLLVEEGDIVRAGQTLAELENDEQRIEFDRARATADTRKREYERSTALHDQGLVADEAFDATRRLYEEAKHTADLAELALQRTVIRAPFGGQILTRHIDLGATLSNGDSVFDLADLRPLYADFGIPERHVQRIRPGQMVRLALESETETIDGRIERIAPSVDPESGTVKVTITVQPQPGLRPGTFVRVGVVTATHENTWVVPRSALVPEGRRWHLFRVGDDGEHVERLEVQRGFEEENWVEVEPTDPAIALSDADRIVVTGASALSDGARIADDAS